MATSTSVIERSEYKTSDGINDGELIVNVHVNGHVAQEHVGRIKQTGTGPGCFEASVRKNAQVRNPRYRIVAPIEELVGYFDDLESALREIETRHCENNPGWPAIPRWAGNTTDTAMI